MTASPKFVITGPTGWIGSALIHRISERFGGEWPSKVTAFGSSERVIDHSCGVTNIRALADITPADLEGAYVYHLAYLTKDRLGGAKDSEFVRANLAIDELVLDAAKASTPRGIFVASSGAAADAEARRSRNVYGIAKLIQEDKFLDFSTQYSVPVLVGRIFNLAGPYVNKLDSYAMSNFILQAITRGSVHIAADKPVYRSFLHVYDLIDLTMAQLESSDPGILRPVDLCGPEVLEMQDLADAVCRLLGGERPLPVTRPVLNFNNSGIYLGDPTATRSLALRFGLQPRDFACQLRDTVEYVRGCLASSSGQNVK